METESYFLSIKDIEMEQLRCVRFIKTPVQHFGAYFCFGVYLWMLKIKIKVAINIEDETV